MRLSLLRPIPKGEAIVKDGRHRASASLDVFPVPIGRGDFGSELLDGAPRGLVRGGPKGGLVHLGERVMVIVIHHGASVRQRGGIAPAPVDIRVQGPTS